MKELIESLKKTGFPAAYHHFEERQGPKPPFIVYYEKGTNNMIADGKVYKKICRVNVELYTDCKDLEAEEKVEMALDEIGACWEKEEDYIESERMYEVLYEMEV